MSDEKQGWGGAILGIVLIATCITVAIGVGDAKKRVWRTGDVAPVTRVKDDSLLCRRGSRSIAFWYTIGGHEYEVFDHIDCEETLPEPLEAVYKPTDPTEAYVLTEYRRKIREER